jgi:hypothetical protein
MADYNGFQPEGWVDVASRPAAQPTGHQPLCDCRRYRGDAGRFPCCFGLKAAGLLEKIKHIRPKFAWIIIPVVVNLPARARDAAMVIIAPISYGGVGFGQIFVRADVNDRGRRAAGGSRTNHLPCICKGRGDFYAGLNRQTLLGVKQVVAVFATIKEDIQSFVLDVRVRPQKLPYLVQKLEQMWNEILRIAVAARCRQRLWANFNYSDAILHDSLSAPDCVGA